MWILCRREHGLTWDEFQNLTLAEFEGLEERRAVDIRHARFNAALVTSVIYNANRATDSRPMSPFDFIAGFEDDPEDREREELRRSVRHAVALAFMEMKGKTKEELQEEKRKMIERMKGNGVEDPEGLIHEVYPEL
jgi:hypothetical protein